MAKCVVVARDGYEVFHHYAVFVGVADFPAVVLSPGIGAPEEAGALGVREGVVEDNDVVFQHKQIQA